MESGRAGCDLDLLIDDVNPGDHLRDWVLDLHARVHFDEEELSVLVEELDRPGADVAQFRHSPRDNSADAVALLGVQGRGGTFLPHLLVAALQGAVALAEVNGVALGVAEHLDFDVARLGQIFLKIDGVVAEGGLRFDLGGGDSVGEFIRPARDFHARGRPRQPQP